MSNQIISINTDSNSTVLSCAVHIPLLLVIINIDSLLLEQATKYLPNLLRFLFYLSFFLLWFTHTVSWSCCLFSHSFVRNETPSLRLSSYGSNLHLWALILIRLLDCCSNL
ncbi:hypothetical protein MtrunA17_Chr4g0032091 [Medicago truncatula]|uniref:Transmembrane protein n=1 Tax=Medicago truncatula TaxID=3880 RepID=I3SLR0_MEDTR|nr:unknown [Medicago truncatula]AFK48568.1 unknown [Medicago truncatula]RHN61020.1 hypothetical protein MtrunA17_Chr4g0032091 [Medicago truncatula]